MKNMRFIVDFDLFSLGWTSPYTPETLFINIAWKTWKWDKIRDITNFIIAMINFESIQNTLRRMGLMDHPPKLDDLIEKHPQTLDWLDHFEEVSEK